MKTELPLTGDPAIDDLPFEKRYRVCMAIAMAAVADDRTLAENPDCHTFIRPAWPDEIPTAQPGEVWAVAVRRDQPGDPLRAYIRLPVGTPSDRELSQEEAIQALLKAGVVKFVPTSHRHKEIAKNIRKQLGPNATCYVLNGMNVVVTC